MFGNIVNALAIIAGSLLGLFLFRGRMKGEMNDSLIKATALAILLIGLKNAWAGENMLLIIFSLVIGTFLGELIGIERRLEDLGKFVESKLKGDNIARGFVTASLLYCVGSMAILGSLEGGLRNQHDILLAKAVLDGVISIMFTSTLGAGVIFSAIPVFIYQGAIVLGAVFVKDLLTDQVIANLSGVGGLLIAALALNQLEVRKIRVGNMLPAVFIPVVYELILKAI
ncbi:DUF554 domain-containing protein [Spirochaeta isovalerica]|uniref:DUF554 domain-containing protein n=1 Tax=Spirochaeta isovalerica TaxID=150 RepID=A0A841RER2_9SPIO|nr:DUF554 domain-containing protein [Spirochaeta isovalerica]MBB6481490.1 hypothetical protein [Spirochaeta isovalerica]